MPRIQKRGKEVGDKTGECEGGNGGCEMELVRVMDEMEWGRCAEERQEMSGSGCIEMCENGKQMWRVSGVLHPTLPKHSTFSTSQHTNNNTKEGSVDRILSAIPGLNTYDEN